MSDTSVKEDVAVLKEAKEHHEKEMAAVKQLVTNNTESLRNIEHKFELRFCSMESTFKEQMATLGNTFEKKMTRLIWIVFLGFLMNALASGGPLLKTALPLLIKMLG